MSSTTPVVPIAVAAAESGVADAAIEAESKLVPVAGEVDVDVSLSESSSSSMIQIVLNYKEVLEKEIMKATTTDTTSSNTCSSNNNTNIDIEKCIDIIQQLQKQIHNMTYSILNDTLIGVTVNKLKKILVTSSDNNDTENIQKLQMMIKGLIKSWKQIVNSTSTASNTNGNTNDNDKDTTTHSSTTTTSTTTTSSTSTSKTTTKATASKSSIAIKESKAKVKDDSKQRRDSLDSSKKNNNNNSIKKDIQDDDNDDNDNDTPTTIDPNIAFNHLQDVPRISFCQKLYSNIFLKHTKTLIQKEQYHPNVIPTLLYNTCINMEQVLYNEYYNKKKNHYEKKGYGDKARSLLFNLNKNTTLTISILLGHVRIEDVIQYSAEQLANEQMQLIRKQTQQKLIDSKRLDWNEANEDKINSMCGIKGDLLQASLFTCNRCKSIKTTSTQKQTRSADEPMTVFVLCLNCGKRWKC